ncbi:VWA domain-containing protein [Actinokineospora sp. HUAS TT18]|uniref:VWA domain-containing protein n=1 Tax=Actinokineospora sp. HUAS TT18 TaxID=3447451 RepID=UPI003F522956
MTVPRPDQAPSAAPRRRRGRTVPIAVALILGVLTPPAAAQDPQPQVKPISMVVLVDESGSINEDDLRRERDAASTIALGEYAPGSTVTVVGFASDNGGQSPVDVVCPPVNVGTAQDQQTLADCVRKVRKRGDNEGNGTDHYAALQQAMTYLSTGDTPKMIFLLTDGVLDVSDSPRYGPDNAGDQRNAAARQGIESTLADARRKGVQVWPLGFGKVDKDQLDHFAASGAQGSCGPSAPKPSATVVNDSSTVADVLLRAFSSARCAGTGDIQRTRLSPGGTESVTVRIPEIATDGSIVVVKSDPKVTVEFSDPQGRAVPKNGTDFGSTFQGSGANGPVEALRIINPNPGDWKVTLSSPADLPVLDVSAVVIWQGAVRATLTVNPPSPQKGQQVQVLLTLHTRTRSIKDPRVLSTLDFRVTMDEKVGVATTDDGNNGDQQAGDGIYTGTVTIPDTDAKQVRFDGTVSGIGITGDTRTVNAVLSSGRAGLAAQIRVPAGATVAPGESIEGSVVVNNLTGTATKVHVQLDELSPGTTASVPGEDTVFDVPATGNTEYPFRVAFAANTALGANSLVVNLVDESGATLASFPLIVTVATPPPPTPWWLYIGLPLLLVALTAVLLWRRARRAARDVRGLAVYLYVNGKPAGDIAVPEVQASSFQFAVRHEGSASAYLDHVHTAGDPDAHTLTRLAGVVTLRTPTGGRHVLRPGERSAVGATAELEVRDERATADADTTQPYADDLL